MAAQDDPSDSNEEMDDYSGTSHDSTTNEAGASSQSKRDDKLNVGQRETQAVFGVRFLIFVILLLAALAVSLIVYFNTSKSQQNEYETQYEGAYRKVQSSFLDIVKIKLGSIATLGVAIMAHGDDGEHDREWPFVTLPRFQQRAMAVRSQSGALYIHVNHMVTQELKSDWMQYASGDDNQWIQDGVDYQNDTGLFDFDPTDLSFSVGDSYRITPRPFFWYRDENEVLKTDYTEGVFMPSWQASPVFRNGQEVNENILKSERGSVGGPNASFTTGKVVTGELLFAPPGNMSSFNPRTELFSLLLSTNEQKMVQYAGDPFSQVFFPIFDSFDTATRKPVAVMVAWVHWMDFFHDLLPSNLLGIIVVLQDTCNGGTYTYQIDGTDAIPLGMGDLHDRSFDNMKRTVSYDSVNDTMIVDGTKAGLMLDMNVCSMMIDIYPSTTFKNAYTTNLPALMTSAVAIIFVFTALVFLLYDRLVARRQNIVMNAARKTNAIVISLFPKQVRDRLLSPDASPTDSNANNKNGNKSGFMAPNRRLKGYLDGDDSEDGDDDAPIADLFPHCTVCFADIAGFTAWSSTREPQQVFILLQNVYAAFDKVAKRRKVFKVETIGDSYVSVTGLPEPQPQHALIMARFASDCKIKMNEVTSQLENRLGPDTGDLTMRFGLHSGPVTAGVLRGERARFQLFGDTVNTAARMESTGLKGRIQISRATYDILVEAGKSDWVVPRSDAVKAKGKGMMKTFWLDAKAKKAGSSSAGSQVDSNPPRRRAQQKTKSMTALATMPTRTMQQQMADGVAKKKARLVNWIVDMLQEDMRKLVAIRKPTNTPVEYIPSPGRTSLDEVAEVIKLPRFDKKAGAADQRSVKINPVVLTQLNHYVTTIAALYHDNPFHNFEHACHVSMSTNKFLKRIVAPDIQVKNNKDNDIANQVHEKTHGINSDPLTLLAIVFSALIHDADHRGISNGQLAVEHPELAAKYHNKSLAEQNSLDIAWEILMSNMYVDLRNCLFTTDAELKRFRQVLVNVVLATDIFDKELNGLRKARWEKAFSSDTLSQEENNDLRATIVIEHIIQASDVSHTMQHWHIYRKWNRKLFEELYQAFHHGRMAKDPSEFWYKGELGFFDNYIIPLAKKLKECNVFGVSSDECLNFALQNRAEWEEKGEAIVAEMKEELEAEVQAADELERLEPSSSESSTGEESESSLILDGRPAPPEAAPLVVANGMKERAEAPFAPTIRRPSARRPSNVSGPPGPTPMQVASISRPLSPFEAFCDEIVEC